MKINTLEFSQWCFNESVLIEAMIPLAGATDGVDTTEALGDLLAEMSTKDFRRLFGDAVTEHAFNVHNSRKYVDVHAALDAFGEFHVYGFVVRATRPVKKPHADGNGASWSRGHSYVETFYVADLDELQPKFAAWCAECWAAECKEAGVANPST